MSVKVDITDPTANQEILSGIPMSWRSLPSDPELALTTLLIISAGLVIWGFMFFVGCYHHPIPSYYEKRMTKEDKLIWRFRVINSYHGGLAFILGIIWYVTQFTTEYTRKNNLYELIMLSNTSSYLVIDALFMWSEGFLDGGNLLHHVFGILGYYSVAYF